MKRLAKMIILAAVLLVTCTSAVSAFTIENYVQDPSGSLAPDTPVTVSYTIGIASTSDLTIPAENDLVMTTELANPNWTSVLILDGVEDSERLSSSGQKFTLTGWRLSFPSDMTEKVRVTLTGTTPGVSSPTSKTILDIYEINNLGNITAATHVTNTALVGKVAHQDGLLDPIIGLFKSLFGMQS